MQMFVWQAHKWETTAVTYGCFKESRAEADCVRIKILIQREHNAKWQVKRAKMQHPCTKYLWRLFVLRWKPRSKATKVEDGEWAAMWCLWHVSHDWNESRHRQNGVCVALWAPLRTVWLCKAASAVRPANGDYMFLGRASSIGTFTGGVIVWCFKRAGRRKRAARKRCWLYFTWPPGCRDRPSAKRHFKRWRHGHCRPVVMRAVFCAARACMCELLFACDLCAHASDCLSALCKCRRIMLDMKSEKHDRGWKVRFVKWSLVSNESNRIEAVVWGRDRSAVWQCCGNLSGSPCSPTGSGSFQPAQKASRSPRWEACHPYYSRWPEQGLHSITLKRASGGGHDFPFWPQRPCCHHPSGNMSRRNLSEQYLALSAVSACSDGAFPSPTQRHQLKWGGGGDHPFEATPTTRFLIPPMQWANIKLLHLQVQSRQA